MQINTHTHTYIYTGAFLPGNPSHWITLRQRYVCICFSLFLFFSAFLPKERRHTFFSFHKRRTSETSKTTNFQVQVIQNQEMAEIGERGLLPIKKGAAVKTLFKALHTKERKRLNLGCFLFMPLLLAIRLPVQTGNDTLFIYTQSQKTLRGDQCQWGCQKIKAFAFSRITPKASDAKVKWAAQSWSRLAPQ